MRNLYLRDVLSVLSEAVMIFPDVSQLHVSLLFVVVAHIEHVGFFVFLLLVSCNSVSIDRMGWT